MTQHIHGHLPSSASSPASTQCGKLFWQFCWTDDQLSGLYAGLDPLLPKLELYGYLNKIAFKYYCFQGQKTLGVFLVNIFVWGSHDTFITVIRHCAANLWQFICKLFSQNEHLLCESQNKRIFNSRMISQ